DIGKLAKERKSFDTIVDARGLVVSPGFIDTHSHSGLTLLAEPNAEAKVMMGVTTEFVGVDGLSAIPVKTEDVPTLRKNLAGLDGEPEIDWSWRTVGDYLEKFDKQGTSVNVGVFAGNGAVRLFVVGFEDRPATRDEIDSMKSVTAEALKEGAFGLSSGLIYPPSMYADTSELIELCKVVAEYDGVYVTHIRNESDALIEAVHEAIEIGAKSGAKVLISHFKAIGKANWGKVKQTLEIVEQARHRGIDVSCDQYPYTAGSTMLTALLPTWSLAGGVEKMLQRLRDNDARQRISRELSEGIPGWENFVKAVGWENIIVSYCRRNKILEGKTLSEIASSQRKQPADALFDLLIEEEGAASMVLFLAHEDDVRLILQHPVVNACTDGLMSGKPHPRLYGTFPRILGHFARDERLLSLDNAIRKITSLPASRLGLRNRGVVAVGMSADLVLFNAQTVIDKATYAEPRQFPEGIEYVIVNGKITVKEGKHIGTKAGKALRRGNLE
ncbi:MAG: amidohydrolase family protein, partial [Candidatus Bathyarchaeia archaeon]